MNKKLKKQNQDTPDLTVVSHQSSFQNLACPQCLSTNYVKQGFRGEKQRYKCKECNYQFLVGSTKQISYPEFFQFENDIWLPEHLGLERNKHRTEKSLSFSEIHYNWLKCLTKQFIYYSSSTKSWGTVSVYGSCLKDFSRFLETIGFNGKIEDINRKVIIDYLSYLQRLGLSRATIKQRIHTLRSFFQTGLINQWFDVESYLVRPEDTLIKKHKNVPRYIPEEVIQQLNQNLDKLPKPIMRMVLVLQETGIRIGELCQLSFNCLKSDGKGQYQIQLTRWKMKSEDIIPISLELAQVIEEQQQYIQENLGDKFEYLFCGRKCSCYFSPFPKVISKDSFINHLKRLAEECRIKDNSGKIWNFQSHQFRHTVGTRMINNGVPQHIVQRYLGHESPEMTMVYAHIHDETLRKEIEKYHESRAVNFQGETVELEETVLSSNDDLEWFKKNVQARALEHGYCARPKVLGDCDIPGFDGCYTCPHWRTNKNFLPILEDTLERTNKVIEKARNCGNQQENGLLMKR